MATTLIVLTFSIGGLGIITIVLAGNIIYHGWKLHFYIREKYPEKIDSYKNKFIIFSATKIMDVLDSNDSNLKEIATMLEKRTKYFLYLFSFSLLTIALVTASGLVLHIFNKLE